MEKNIKDLSTNSILIDNILKKLTSIRMAPGVRLRREFFGGLVYDTRNGNTLEVDKSAFQLLRLIKDRALKVDDLIGFLVQNNIMKKQDRSMGKVLAKLVELNIIERRENGLSSPVLTSEKWSEVVHKPWISAPETVHWAVTYHCDENCTDCYTRRLSFIKNELNTNNALRLIDRISDWGVFQLAIGGGEPFSRHDLPHLVQHAAARGLSVHITTGRRYLEPQLLEDLAGSIKSLQIGLRPYDLIGSGSVTSMQQVQALLTTVQSKGITPGANLFLTKSVIHKLSTLVKRLVDIGFNRIILLRYKPPESVERWEAENPTERQMKGLHEKINNIFQRNHQLEIRIDCSLSFVQRHMPIELATQLGIKGCVAADRIIAVAPDGSAYPCSQLVHPGFYAGNLLEFEPQMIWDQSRTLRKYRFFRTKKLFKHSWCGICQVKNSCGGCRVFASDGLGGDPGCPEPLLPPLTQLGKIGRTLDLAEYLKEYGAISINEYVERYRVGKKRAIKELKDSPEAVYSEINNSYVDFQEDIISDIQDTIGDTSAGFPYASYEQIAEWIKDPEDSGGYPKWIKQRTSIQKDNLFIETKKKKRNKGSGSIY